MSNSTTFVDKQTVISAGWANDVDATVFEAIGDGSLNPPTTPAQVRANLGLTASSGASLIGYTEGGTGAVATTVQGRMRQNISVFDFIPVAEQALISAGTPSIDVSAYIQAAHDALINMSLNRQGELYFPPGKYKCVATALVFTPTVRTRGWGANLDFSGASNSITAITVVGTSVGGGGWGDTTVGDPLGGLRLSGPGGTSIGVLFGGGAVGNICHEKSFRDLHVEGFGTGVQLGSNAYNLDFFGGFLQNNGINLYLPTGLTNSTERIGLHGMTIANGTTNNIKHHADNTDLSLYNCSVDYLNAAAGGTSIDVAGDAILNMYTPHLEDSANGAAHIFINNATATGAPFVSLFSPTLVISQGQGTYVAINAVNIHLTWHGGRYRVATGTQGTLISSTGTTALDCAFEGGLGTVTTEVDIGAQTQLKYFERAGSLVFGATLPNAKSLQAQVSGGTNYPIAYITASDKYRVGNSNVPLELDLKVSNTSFYTFQLVGEGSGAAVFAFYTGAGAPTGGVAGYKKGCICPSFGDGKVYVNTNDTSSATWTVVGTQT